MAEQALIFATPMTPHTPISIAASRITNLTDARYFAAKEVDILGFNLEEGTEGYLDPMYMKAIREWVEGPKIMGEFDRTPARTVREAASFYGLDAVQVTQATELHELAGLDVVLALAGPASAAEAETMMQAAAVAVSGFVLDFSGRASAEQALLEQAAAWQALFARYPVRLLLDVPAERLPALLDALRPAGLVLRGGEEEKVGIKSFEQIDAIFDILGLD